MGKAKRHNGTRATVTGSGIYPNSPLAEVVFELRFTGEPAIECRRDEYFQTIRSEFPKVLVPNVEAGTPPALQPYQFKTEDEHETIMAAINRFAYSTKKYGRFTKFRPRALKLAKNFCKQFSLTKLSRIGLRYINIVPFIRDTGHIPWQQFFNVRMNLPCDAFDCLTNANLVYEAKCDTGTITTRIACVRSNTPEEAFLLDFDFAQTEKVTAARLSSSIQEAHDHTKRVFEETVSDQYKMVMRGEVIE